MAVMYQITRPLQGIENTISYAGGGGGVGSAGAGAGGAGAPPAPAYPC